MPSSDRRLLVLVGLQPFFALYKGMLFQQPLAVCATKAVVLGVQKREEGRVQPTGVRLNARACRLDHRFSKPWVLFTWEMSLGESRAILRHSTSVKIQLSPLFPARLN